MCKSENEDSIYVRFDKEPLLSLEKSEAISNDNMEVCDENYKMSYFTTYKPYFNDIDVNLGEGRVINEILKLKNTNWDATKYYEQKKGVKRGLGVYYLNNDIYNLGLSYKKGLKPIPVNQELVKKNVNRVYLKDLYVLMYIYKGLKRYRNSVAHASEVDDQNIPNLTRSEVEKWIELFIIRLDKFLKDVAPICGGIFR